MSTELLEILPRELKFTFELKKQCSCSVRLINKSNNHVAFKVKTTSPKKYCVRPNTGIIKPKSICDFTVTMQAQRLAPPDMICKDKFLVQSTVVPAGTADEDITTSMFARDDDRYVEENKLRVILVSPPSSPVLSPINGAWKQVSDYEASILKDQVLRKIGSFSPRAVTKDVEKIENKPPKVVNKVEVEEPVKDVNYGIMKDVEEPSKDVEYKIMKDVKEPTKDVEYERMKNVEEPAKDVGYKTMKEVEEPAKDIEHKAMKDVEELAKDIEHKTVKDVEEPAKDIEHKTVKDIEELAKDVEYETMKDEEEPAKGVEYKTWKNTEELKLVKDIEEMKLKVNELESKLSEAVVTISQLTKERRWTAQERESLRQELATVRTKRSVRKVPAGFPFLFVLMVALVSIMLGYLLNN